ncbi:glycosyltransferase [Leptolyngbya sp. FACHB-36]|uniref:glycosyltransferase n=1 Tax=Leptolyngbya sp. FACHB-36 TaxID=2692808 RepID=UPI0016810306|nr:glycosyltransferase [Leptolyngbya sp. FACHB-36]MBD2020297.1 glycosyltransferase [Leptolyngbya sp. FACHB-36]
MRVVAYTDSAGIGGAEISLGHLVATASPTIDLTVVGVSQTVVDAIADRRPQAARWVLPAGEVLAHWFRFQRLRPDIIHLNLCTPWAGAIGLAAAIATPGARVVRVDQLPLRTTDALHLWRTRALSLRVDAHVAVGEASARRMEDFYALGRRSVRSIPNGVPDEGGGTESAAESRPGTLVVGSVGRLDAMKAHDVLLRAMAQVDDVHLIILGDGAERQSLETLATDLGVRDRLELPGWVSNPRRYLPQFDAVALPSRSEGFPLAMVEAMLAARPVVATRVGSMPEAIIHGETGLLIEKDDVAGLANALRCLRDDRSLRLRLGRQARERAIAHYTVEAMMKGYEQLWSSLLMAPRAPRLRIPRPRD